MSEPVPKPEAATPVAGVEAQPCPNCGAILHGPFCFSCGQPKKGLIRHFGGVIGDFFDTVFSLDSRTARTLLPLYLRPGFLSTEYFAGRRVRYVTPLRLYFFLSVIAFLLISTITAVRPNEDNAGGLEFDLDDGPAQVERANDPAAVLKSMEAGLKRLPPEQAEALRERVRAQVQRAGQAEQERAEAERLAKAMNEVLDDAAADEDGDFMLGGDQPWHPTRNPLVLSWLPASLNAALNNEIGELKQKAKSIRRDPAPFVRQIFSVAPQVLFVLLPIFALLLKVFYLFKRRLYMEHLIVALHSHSFIALTILVLIALSQAQSALAPGLLSGTVAFLTGLVWIWLPLYLLIMQKRVYRQNWFATLFKFVLLGSAYMVLLGIGMVGTMLVSLMTF